MFFTENIGSFKIRAVFRLSWDADRRIPETRACHAISFRMRGDSTMFYNDKIIKAKDNDVIFFPQNLTYTIDHQKEELFAIHFDTDVPLPNDIVLFKHDKTFLIEELFSSIYDLWLSNRTSDRFEAHAAFYRLLSELARSEEEKHRDSRLSDVTNYIHEHFRESSLSPSYLAKIFGTSETYFRKTFLSHHGTSPLKYINSLRLKYALELLEFDYHSISEIAEMSGFRDPKYFSRFVKTETGHYPSEIRRKFIEKTP